MKKTILGMFALTAVLFWAASASADSFRCGTKLMSDGDSTDKVAALCGPPTDVQRREILRPYYGYGAHNVHTSYEVSIEYWTYNLGPNKLMRRLRFEDGILVDVETLSHGYNSANSGYYSRAPSRAGCSLATRNLSLARPRPSARGAGRVPRERL